jgi:hypothetical protein
MSKGLILTHLQDEMGSHIMPSLASDNVGALVNLNKKGTKDLVMTFLLKPKKLKSSISTYVLEDFFLKKIVSFKSHLR